MDENMSCQTLSCPSQKERFKGFALSHFAISLAGFCVAFPTAALLRRTDLFDGAAVAGMVVLLLAYAVAGGWFAREKGWARPQSVREGLWAFLAPALVAWGWAALVIASVSVGGGNVLFPLVFFGSFIFALPSSLLVFFILCFCDALLFEYSVLPGLFLTGFLAGGVPPALFLLGSLWGSRKTARFEEGEAADTT